MHLACREEQLDHQDVHTEIHSPRPWLLKEAGKPGSGGKSPRGLLQFLLVSWGYADHARYGRWNHAPPLDVQRFAGLVRFSPARLAGLFAARLEWLA